MQFHYLDFVIEQFKFSFTRIIIEPENKQVSDCLA